MPRRDRNTIAMDGIVQSLGAEFDEIEIIVLADLHIGDRQADVRLIQSLIDSVRDTPNRFCILAGDLLQNATIGSKSDVYTQKMSPYEQLAYAVTLLKPIADKCLACVPGNHEERTSRSSGISLTATICAELGIAECYRDTSALLFVKFGKDGHGGPLCYSVYINHGRGGGRRVGGKMNALQDYGNIIDTDIYVVGHTHLPAMFKDSAFRVAPSKGQATLRERLFVNTSSALRYPGGYGERQGYQPNSNSYPIITLSGKEHKMSATV